MATDDDLYLIYMRIYGQVRSGTKLVKHDYFDHPLKGLTPFSTDEKLAVELAADEAKNAAPPRTRTEILSELKRRLTLRSRRISAVKSPQRSIARGTRRHVG